MPKKSQPQPQSQPRPTSRQRLHLRRRIYDIIEVASPSDYLSKLYDYFLITVIIISLIPIIAQLGRTATVAIDSFALIIFAGDYLLRWLTADYRFRQKSATSFIRYPFTLPAVLNLVIIISFLPFGQALGSFAVFRLVRILHLFRLAKYFKSLTTILRVFHRQRRALTTVAIFFLFYIFISALVVFTAEPATFGSFFDALYWSTTTLTTIGYGDITTVTIVGRLVTMLSSLFGILVVALPTGIITAGYVKVVSEQNKHS